MINTADTIIKNDQFCKQARAYVLSLISQRELLIRCNRSFKNYTEMVENIAYLKLHLNTYPYNSDQLIASFFVRNHHRIYSLLPGEVGNKRYVEFYNFLNKSKKILKSWKQFSLFLEY